MAKHRYRGVDQGCYQGAQEVDATIDLDVEEAQYIDDAYAHQIADEDVACHDEVFAEQYQHSDKDEYNEHKDDEFTIGYAHDEWRRILHGYDKVGYGADHRKEHHAAHSLAIKHEDERDVDQCTTGLFLHQNQDDRQEYDDQSTEVVACFVVEYKVVGTEQLGEGEGCGEFGKLSRLETDGSEYEPRPRAFDVGGYEDGDDQQQEHADVDGVGVTFVDAIVDEQDATTDDERQTYPCDLLAGELLEAEYACVVEVVGCSVDADSTHDDQCHVEHDRHPIDGFKHRRIGFIVVSKFHCRQKFQH